MKIISLLIISIFLLSIGTVALAQETELPEPGLTPDSPLYFLERIAESIRTFFTFGDLKKAERYANLAAERLAEAKALAEKQKTELTEKTLLRYQEQLKKSTARAEEAKNKGEDTQEVMTKIGEAASVHLGVLAEIHGKIAENAQPAVENAIKTSFKEREKVVEALKEQNALGQISEEISLPASLSQEVKNRIQTEARQELQIEKALGEIDASKSLRDICAEKGGTPEMCEKFPLEKFESFEQIETFCLGQGGSAEVCASLENKCRECWITEANECFIVLSTASIQTFQETDPFV